MYRYVETDAMKSERRISGEWWTGIEYFDTKEIAAEFAKALRSIKIRCRRLTLPESSSWTPGNDFPERYIVYLLSDVSAEDWQKAMNILIQWEKEGKI